MKGIIAYPPPTVKRDILKKLRKRSKYILISSPDRPLSWSHQVCLAIFSAFFF
jgi:hypothetical protein